MDAEPAACFGTPDLDDGLIELIKPELAPGERLLWAGQSKERSRSKRWFPEPLGLIWAGASGVGCLLGFVGSVITGPQSNFQGLLIVCGFLSGVVCFLVTVCTGVAWISRLWLGSRQAKSIYAVTDRRAIWWSQERGSEAIAVVSMPRGSIPTDGIRRVQYPDGSGDLHLHGFHPDRQFVGIDDVRRVEELIRSHLVIVVPPERLTY